MTRPAIFQFIENKLLNQKIKVLTPLKSYEGLLEYIDGEGNLKISTNLGAVVIIRKYVVSIEELKE